MIVYAPMAPAAPAAIAGPGMRAAQVRSRLEQQPRREAWASALVTEMLKFPAGKYDDQVDVLSLFGRILNRMQSGSRPEPPEEERILTLADVNIPMLKEDSRRARDRETRI